MVFAGGREFAEGSPEPSPPIEYRTGLASDTAAMTSAMAQQRKNFLIGITRFSMLETPRCLKHAEVSYRYVTAYVITYKGLVNETSVAGPTAEAIRAQLQRILESPVFSTARRLSQFLQFVVSRSIEGQAGDIKEYLIGVEVYNRSASYDTRAEQYRPGRSQPAARQASGVL